MKVIALKRFFNGSEFVGIGEVYEVTPKALKPKRDAVAVDVEDYLRDMLSRLDFAFFASSSASKIRNGSQIMALVDRVRPHIESDRFDQIWNEYAPKRARRG